MAIRDPFFLFAAFVALVFLLHRAADHPTFGRVFRFLPIPFWCYFLPMLGSAVGLLPRENPLYPFLSQQLLPVCLTLLLLGADLPGLARIGPPALGMMLAGSAGTVIGGLASCFLYQRWLPEGSWAAVGALAGSWTGGSANLLAVKEALGVSDALIGPIILVDAAVAYSWMGVLIGSSGLQEIWAQICGRPPGSPDACRPLRGRLRSASDLAPACPEARRRSVAARSSDAVRTRGPAAALLSICIAVLSSLIAQGVAQRLPETSGFGASTWTILLVTTAALGMALTPLKKLGERGGSAMGTFLLYVLLCSIGARGNLAAMRESPVFLTMGVTWILIHGGILLAAGRLAKAPLGLIATASQANIGGPISAPLVGAAYSAPLAGAGLLMAILGNVMGTYLGLMTALAARAIGAGG